MGLKIVCLVKQTLPTEAKIQLINDTGLGDPRAKPIINPYDEFAIEEAIQLKEAGTAESVTLVSVGGSDVEESLRRGLAMGADNAVRVDNAGEALDEFQVAVVIAKALKSIAHDLIFCGRISVDSGAGEVPGRIAALLDLPLLHVATKIEISGNDVTVHRAADGGIVVVKAAMPAMVSADKSLNKPRYPNLPSIMKAKKKPLEVLNAAALLGDAKPTRRVVQNALPPERGPVRMLDGGPEAAAKELVRILVDEEKIIH